MRQLWNLYTLSLQKISLSFEALYALLLRDPLTKIAFPAFRRSSPCGGLVGVNGIEAPDPV